uniref:Selenoprotein P N-terminal domain-containing protein n=1 Tax=Kryptolebias marmoratus TaxID=37003 RepID=A0A3Q3BST7_KRYMA
MVVNDQGGEAERLHPLLAQRLSENILLHKQSEQQPRVWQTLNGKKDDFLIYDRCGRLTHHISLPYSIIGHGHIERAIKDTYCNQECTNAAVQPNADAIPPVGDNTEHGHGRHHGQGHQRHHGHGHHGHGHHPRGFGQGHDHNHGTHHGNHDGVAHGSDQGQSQHQLDVDDMQQVVLTQQMLQEAGGAPVSP